MKALINKELTLNTNWWLLIFSILNFLVLLPNFPIAIVFIYAVSFFSQSITNLKYNNDFAFSCILPVSRKNIVSAKIVTIVIQQLILIATLVPAIVIAYAVPQLIYNESISVPNLSLIAIAFVSYGAFNLFAFPMQFAFPNMAKLPVMGGVFLMVAFAFGLSFGIFALGNANPNIAMALNSFSLNGVPYQLLAILVAMLLFALMTFLACIISAKVFEKKDI